MEYPLQMCLNNIINSSPKIPNFNLSLKNSVKFVNEVKKDTKIFALP